MPARIIEEDEFCRTWRLDKMARQRLAELPESSRQQAMQRFNPGPEVGSKLKSEKLSGEVPESDFPKLFVAFLKRFKTKAPRFRGFKRWLVDRMVMKRRDGVGGR